MSDKIKNVISSRSKSPDLKSHAKEIPGQTRNDRTKRTIFIRFLLVFLLVPIWIYLRSVYRDRIGAFGCFDDCNNMMGGYFLLSGKHLFSQIFFNHMPSMAYISAAIMHFTRPDSLYMLIYEHRMFIIYLSVIADILLTLRFGVAGFGFALLFETTKGFIFGDRFLAEPIVVYPVVYLWGIIWEFIQKKRVSPPEIWLAVNLTWFVIFSREPYIPLVFVLFGTIIWFTRRTVRSWWPGVLLILMSSITILYFGAADFIFNVFTVNQHNIRVESAQVSAQNGGIWSVVLYPLQIFTEGKWNMFHRVEAGLMLLLLGFGILFVLKTKRYIPAVLFAAVLTMANIRTIIPGSLYYGTFHHILWYALVIFAVCTLIVKAWAYRSFRVLAASGSILYIGLISYALLSKESYLREIVDRQTEFTNNYSQYYVVGETVRLLSQPGDSLFLDGQDDLIYWQAGRYSHYPYSWYTSLMPLVPRYSRARDIMMKNDPPVFFYGRCSGHSSGVSSLPQWATLSYVRLNHNGIPSCLYIRADRVSQINEEQWKSIEQFNYSLPLSLKS